MARTIGRMGVFYADLEVSIAISSKRTEFQDWSQEIEQSSCSRTIPYGSIAMLKGKIISEMYVRTVRRRLTARLAAVGAWRIFKPIAQTFKAEDRAATMLY